MKRQFDAACRQYQVKTPHFPVNMLDLSGSGYGYITSAGTLNNNGNHNRNTKHLPVEPGTAYTICVNQKIYNIGIALYDSAGKLLSRTNNSQPLVKITTPSTAATIRIWFSFDEVKDMTEKFTLSLEPQLLCGVFEAPPTYRAYGDPATTAYGRAEWEDALKSGFPSVKMLGKTEQQTYLGTNVLDIVQIFGDGYTNTLNGVTVEIKDGYAHFSGTHTNSGWSNVLAKNIPSSGRPVLPAGSYSLPAVDNQGTFAVTLVDMTLGTSIGNKTGTFSIENDCAVSMIYIAFRGEIAVSTSVPLVLTAGPALVIEPYVGGKPSPNPQYPQEVKANNATVRSCVKNLFNMKLIQPFPEGDFGTWVSEVGSDYIIVSEKETYNGNGECRTGLTLRELAPALEVGKTYCVSFSSESASDMIAIKAPSLKIWWNKVALTITEEFLDAEIRIYGRRTHDGSQTPGDCRISNMQIEEGTSATAYQPYYDGGEATAPLLMCAVDGSCQSTYDPQTGKFVNWWWDKITLDGSEEWFKYTSYEKGFYVSGVLLEVMDKNAYWCTGAIAEPKGVVYDNRGMHLFCGWNNAWLYTTNNPFYDESAEDFGVSNWKAHLSEHPLEVWVARNEPEITNIGAQRMTCPTGYGQIIQTAGDISDCPFEVKYLAHGGNVK